MAKKSDKRPKSQAVGGIGADLRANGAEEIAASDPPAVSSPAVQAASEEALQRELSEIRELAGSLRAAVEDMGLQVSRAEMLRGAVEGVRADARAATQALLAAQPSAAMAVVDPRGIELPGKCGPCECVSDDCCCFDIKIASVRAAKPQIEPADMGDIPGLINALEVQMYFTVDEKGFLLPGLGSTFDLRADGAPGGPGPQVVVDRVVNRVCFRRGTTVTSVLKCQVREEDEGAERLIGMKDEIGEGQGTITLDCCMDKIYPPMPIEVYLIHGGEGRGMVQVFFYARS